MLIFFQASTKRLHEVSDTVINYVTSHGYDACCPQAMEGHATKPVTCRMFTRV